mgnify:CR=1 FL=1
MFQQTQNEEYLKLCVNRVRGNLYLTWVEQFLDIIQENVKLEQIKTLNDIGCNVGQFWKGLYKRNLNIDYRGYDFENIYLNCAKKIFPDLEYRISLLDVATTVPKSSDISICSATLEHLEDWKAGLENVLDSTKECVLLRTFLGESFDTAKCFKSGAEKPYLINQYSCLDIYRIMKSRGFITTPIRDRFTDSLPHYLEGGIVRTFYIILGQKQ